MFDIELVCKIALNAGKEIMHIYNSAKEIHVVHKSDDSPLTKADLASHSLILEQLLSVYPEIPLVSEEGHHGDPNKSQYSWLVDPLDGTKEFIKRNGMFTVNIALMQKIDDRWKPVLGVVHAPATSQTWIGSDGSPAFAIDSQGRRRISVNEVHNEPVRIVASGSHRSKIDEEFADNVGKHELIRMGSSIKACAVADGTADIYPRFGPTSCWDTAAAHAIVSSAGGNILDPEGNDLDYDIVNEILNPFFIVTSNNQWVERWIACQDYNYRCSD
jgi:3'(2'), 5'-bisphosphate nucleotidase